MNSTKKGQAIGEFPAGMIGRIILVMFFIVVILVVIFVFVKPAFGKTLEWIRSIFGG